MLEVGDIVLCTVDRIVGTIVFVKIENEKREGSIILSEVAPGRIRNLRAHVVPKKRIACKILRIAKDRIDLSLRRVTPKEKKEVMNKHKQEKSYKSILKTILKESSKKIIEKILEKESLYEFIENSKKNPKELEKLVGKENSKKILEILKSQKIKKFEIKKEIKLHSSKENGLELIKKLFENLKEIKVSYISAGKYSLKIQGEDLKKLDNQLREILKEIEEKAKKQEIEFSLIEK